MPLYDLECENGHEQIDVWLRIADLARLPACQTCQAPTSVKLSTHAVVSDEIPGGIEIKHGLCNADGSPRRYYSKTEIAREAARRGMTNHVTHIPKKGSDKSPHTVRWV